MDNIELIKLALKAKDRAYVPYSNFSVGSAVLMEDGSVYLGANIENAAYTPTICAERNAISTAIFSKEQKIVKIAVVGDSEFTFPCGVCRQVIREFGKDARILVANKNLDYKEYSLDQLLPNSFGPEDLG